jgi:Uncharacterized conserved protein
MGKNIKNAQSLRQHIKNKARETKLSPQIIMQNYMIERLLERISVSRYKCNFIIKGGVLLSSIMGIENRATMDLDATLKGLKLSKELTQNILSEILEIKIDDDVIFKLNGFVDIRVQDLYPGLRVSLTAFMEQMKIPLVIDITTGDKITPKEIEYDYKLLFEDRKIKIMSYNIETVLSEKLHAILSLGEDSTRMRDYYDVYTLYNLYKNKFDANILSMALYETCKRKNTLGLFKDYKAIIERIKQYAPVKNLWIKYQQEFVYAHGIDFMDICNLIMKIMEELAVND